MLQFLLLLARCERREEFSCQRKKGFRGMVEDKKMTCVLGHKDMLARKKKG